MIEDLGEQQNTGIRVIMVIANGRTRYVTSRHRNNLYRVFAGVKAQIELEKGAREWKIKRIIKSSFLLFGEETPHRTYTDQNAPKVAITVPTVALGVAPAVTARPVKAGRTFRYPPP